MVRAGFRRIIGWGILAASISAAPHAWAQAQRTSPAIAVAGEPDAQHTQEELSQLLDHYPPAVRNVISLDPSLLANQDYLAPYPALVSFLSAHPEVAHNPGFYFGVYRSENATAGERMWDRIMDGLGVFAGFGLAIGVITWLTRTFIDYRRWNRLTKVQTDVHTKLLDRFSGNEELLEYIKSPAGSKFLESSPITLDAGQRSVGAPLGRILWSVQAGVVLAAAGVGLLVVSGQVTADAAQAFHAMGVFGIALGLGFVISAVISFVISQRLGLIETSGQA